MNMEKCLYPNHPLPCIKCGPSNVGKSVLLINWILNIINKSDRINIYSPSLYQDLYQKLINCFTNYIPIQRIPKTLKEEDTDLVIEEVINNEDFQKSDTEIETYESIDELKYPQEYEAGGIIILDDLNEKKINDPPVRAMFKRSRHSFLFIFIISQDYYELPTRTIRANGNIYHIFKPNNFRDVQNLYQDKPSMDMTLNEFKHLTSTCWNEKHQSLKIDMTKDKYAGRYRLGLNSIFVPDSSPIQTLIHLYIYL